jgi:glycosyltransferase involved in cell wall biosynthesis
MGGGERHLVELSDALAMRGHEVYLGLRRSSLIRDRLESIPSNRVYSLDLRNSLDIKSAFQISALIRKHSIQIVHAHLARDYPMAAMAARRNKGASVVLTRHVLFPLSRIHSFTLSRVSRVIAVSEAVAKALKSQSIFPAERIKVVHNGLDFSRLDNISLPIDRRRILEGLNLPVERRLVATVGDLNPLKGHEELLRAAARLVQRFDDVDFVIVGADQTRKREYRAYLASIARELELGKRIHFVDWVDDLAVFMRSIEVFVSSSRSESFGLAILESMACGTPVVATRTGGAQELIGDQKAGLLVNIGDSSALANAIASLLENPVLANEIAAAASVRARENFGLEQMVKGTEGVYIEAEEQRLGEQMLDV